METFARVFLNEIATAISAYSRQTLLILSLSKGVLARNRHR